MKRDRVIDILKCLGIVIVIFSHLSYENQALSVIVGSFVMPLFFIVSAHLFKQKSITKVFTSGVKRYLLPAYLFLLVDLIILAITGNLSHILNIKDILLTIGLMGGGMINAPIWFLPAIFAMVLLYTLLKTKKRRIIVSAICLIISGLVQIKTGALLWPLVVMEMLPIYTFANYVKILSPRKINPLLFVTELTLFISLALLNGYTSLIQQIFGVSYYIFLATGLLGTHILYQICSFIKNLRISDYMTIIGKHTMIILLTHYLVCRKVIPIVFTKLGNEYLLHNLVVQITLTVIIVAIYYFGIKIFCRVKNCYR